MVLDLHLSLQLMSHIAVEQLLLEHHLQGYHELGVALARQEHISKLKKNRE